MLVPDIRFSLFSFATVVLFRLAISERVSPCRIVTVFERRDALLRFERDAFPERATEERVAEATTVSSRTTVARFGSSVSF